MRFGVSHLDQSNMKCRIVAVLILVAGYAMSSEPNGDDKQETLDLPDEIKQELKDLPDDIKQELMDLSDVDKKKVVGAFVDIVGFCRFNAACSRPQRWRIGTTGRTGVLGKRRHRVVGVRRCNAIRYGSRLR